MIITDSIEKANVLNSYYVSVFCCDRNVPKMQLANWVKRLSSSIMFSEKKIIKNREKQISKARWNTW
jgi:hypothetical protein